MTKKSSIHMLGNPAFDPSAYELDVYFDFSLIDLGYDDQDNRDFEPVNPIDVPADEDMHPDATFGLCAHCGKKHVKGGLFTHTPTGKFVGFGLDCLLRMGKDETAEEIKALIKAKRLWALKARRILEKRPELQTEVKELVAIILDPNSTEKSEEIARSMISKVAKYGLTEKQQSFIMRMREIDAKCQANEKRFAEERARANKWESDGAHTVTGRLVSIKVSGFRDYKISGDRLTRDNIEHAIHDRNTERMQCMIKLEDGRCAWGSYVTSMPRDTEPFTFTGTFTVSNKDNTMAFYKRPRKVALVA